MAEPTGGYESTRGQIHADLERVRAICVRRGCGEALAELAGEIDAQAHRTVAAAVVCIVGPTGAGKSTLLNALAGKPVAKVGIDRPTTETATIYAPLGLDRSLLDELPKAVLVEYEPDPALPWSGHVLIDAPDVNSIRRAHRDIVRDLAAAADVLLVVLHHQAIVEEDTALFVDPYRDRRRIAVVLNRVDEMTAESRQRNLEQLAATAESRWGVTRAPFAVSALRAFEDAGDDPGFVELVAWLGSLVEERAVRGLRRDNLRGAVQRIGSICTTVEQSVAGDLVELENRLNTGWDDFAASLTEDLARRVHARRADVEMLLTAEIARRWRGPGGWMLRLGLWGPLAAAGTFAIRRNPLLAGALAAGGHLAERFKGARAESRLTHRAEIVPASTDLTRWAEDAMRPARMLVDPLGGGEEARLPQASWAGAVEIDAEGLDSLSLAVSEAWDTLIDRDLPEAAEVSRLRWLRLPLDLPLYALGCHVGWQSVVHYVSADYLGVDYYFNAGVLAALVGALSYGLSRGLVALAARGLLRKMSLSVGQVARDFVERGRADGLREVEELQTSLARLSALRDFSG